MGGSSMIEFEVKLRKYDWKIKVMFIVNYYNLQDVVDELKYVHCPSSTIDKMYDTLYALLDSGFAFTNPREHISYMVINNASSIAEFLDTFEHEKNHVEMHICEELDIDPYSEEASYLSGHIAKAIYLAVLDNLRY